ncbi:hypothetical protein HF521_022574 [Silurus meridionalis]|uniref:Uncharacterized protein n=1 Tax=Silurus meridionalis TaxID=175797 RepID=A0A8T0BCZ2_SILME|nr:hypothetical protein HF521_022574 [Silurus meridionalis]
MGSCACPGEPDEHPCSTIAAYVPVVPDKVTAGTQRTNLSRVDPHRMINLLVCVCQQEGSYTTENIRIVEGVCLLSGEELYWEDLKQLKVLLMRTDTVSLLASSASLQASSASLQASSASLQASSASLDDTETEQLLLGD